MENEIFKILAFDVVATNFKFNQRTKSTPYKFKILALSQISNSLKIRE